MTVLRSKLALVAVLVVFVFPVKTFAGSVNYNIPSYYNPICGCCKKPGEIMHQIFWGTGLWTTPDDFQNEFYIDNLFSSKIEIALQEMSDQLRDTLITHALMVGAFLDGQSELNSLATLQKLNARTMKDYAVSDQICRFGTVSRSLALSDNQSDVVQVELMQHIQDRQLMKQGMNAGFAQGEATTIGATVDKKARLLQLKKKFCDPYDVNQAWNSSGFTTDRCEATSDKQQNRDIDFTRTVDSPENLNVDFPTDAGLTDDEENVIALGSNIYAHNLFNNLGKSDLADLKANGASKSTENQTEKLLDFRSLVAKRSVAANTFAAITGMKARGGSASVSFPSSPAVTTGASTSRNYLYAIAKELGLSSTDDIKTLVGDNPSYDAQMEFLTKRLYQTPNFYVNLYDTPANIERQQAALEAIGLMQDRDIFESLRRSEMLLSVLMEVQVQRQQDRYFNKGLK